MTQKDLIETVQLQTIEDEFVMLFEIALEDGSFIYFHSGYNIEDDTRNLGSDPRGYAGTVEFKHKDYPSTQVINTYFPLPCELDGLAVSSEGAAKRPTITIANVLDHFQDALGDLRNEDLIGQRIVMRSTLRKYLMSTITGGTATDDGTSIPVEFPRQSYIIDRIASLNAAVVSFELANPMDLPNVVLPNRIVVGKYCSWQYKGKNAANPIGACAWTKNSVKPGTTNDIYFYNVKDQPLLSSGRQGDFTTYSGAVDYTAGALVIEAGEYYIAPFDVPQTGAASPVIPGTTGSANVWIPVRFWTNWTPAGSKSYFSDNRDPLAGEHVLYPNSSQPNPNVNDGLPTVWRCTTSHTSGSATAPKLGSSFWEPADICGKTITSCKIRFQATKASGSGTSTVPAYNFNTQVPLPFGGFPGVVKFK